jgi:pimeloyl-ACP methyl ester carboxylesterase
MLGGMRWLRYFVYGIVLLLVGGAIFQGIATSKTLHHPPGALVDLGGYRMHLNCTGSGGPVVVMDSGNGDSWLSWRDVQPRIAEFTRVCSYDRAGMGWSDPSPNPRTPAGIAEELHALLRKANVPAPYILVGHSLGGVNVRAYANRYREDVAGMVLVDSSHEEQVSRMPPEMKKYSDRVQILETGLEYSMPFGVPRMMGFCRGATVECGTGGMREAAAEYRAFVATPGRLEKLGDLPLRVLSRDPNHMDAQLPRDLYESVNRVWEQLQIELAAASTKGTRTVAPGCGHYVHQCKPDLFVDTVRELVKNPG